MAQPLTELLGAVALNASRTRKRSDGARCQSGDARTMN
jgi:hypothetical protein